mgnify:CR=1 FL=1|jgi:hypothetical protein
MSDKFDAIFGEGKAREPSPEKIDPGHKLKGSKQIADFLFRCGRKRPPAPQTINSWRKKHKDFPVVKHDSMLVTHTNVLRIWALKHRQIPITSEYEYQQTMNMQGAPGKKPETTEEIMKDLAVEKELDDFLDMSIFNDYPEPTGDVGDELKEARRLRHYFGRIVFSWRLEKLGNPKIVKVFQDFASGLTRQIAVIGRLEESLTKQRMRNGKLLDELTVIDWSRTFADFVTEGFNDLARDLFDVVDEEVGKTTDELGLDFSLNSDKVLKLFDQRFMAERKKFAAGAVDLVRNFQDAQIARMGGDEERRDVEGDEYE